MKVFHSLFFVLLLSVGTAFPAWAADIESLENALELKGAPWTPGRIPDWSSD